MRSLDRSVSAARCFHERICWACRLKVKVPGLEWPGASPVMLFSHCDAELGTSEARGIGTTPVILTLFIGIITG